MSNILQLLPFYLNQALGTSETSFDVKNLKDSRGNLIIAMPSGVAKIIVTIEPQSSNNQEIISFTGITNKGNGIVTLTGVTRNLSPVSPFTALTPAVIHANNVTCIVSDSPQVFQDVVMTNEDRTVSAIVTFNASPTVPNGVNPTDVVNKSQLDAVVAGDIPASSTTVYGAVRMASEQLKTIGTATMTIASPCVVTFNSHGLISNDIIHFTTTSALPTGITANTQYYVMATGLTANTFQISATSGGAAINTSGSQSGTHTLYRDTPYAINDQDTRLPTQGENDALVGTSGTPSSSNKYVTNSDIRFAGVFGGDGSDGVLNVTSGTTTINLGTKSLWQYSSISVSLGATLTFSGGTAGDKVPVLKCQGNFSNAGTITTVGLGVAGGAGGTTATGGSNGTQTVFTFVDGTRPNAGLLGAGATGGAGGAGGAIATKNAGYFTPYALNGSGGGGGGGGTTASGGSGGFPAGGAGGAGGAGSLGIVLEVLGNFSNTGTMTVAGAAGVAGGTAGGNGINNWGSGGGGGGGGGGAGSILVTYKGTYTNSGTVTVTGGAAGAGGVTAGMGAGGGTPTYGYGGGGGSAGATSFNSSLGGGTGVINNSSLNGQPGGGNGSAGGDGILYFAKI